MFFTIYSPKKRLKSMNKRHFWSIFTTTHTLFRSNKAFCIDLFSLFAPKQTSVNNTNRIINAGIFSVYASTQLNYLWRLDWETFTFPSYAKECFLHLSITEVIRIFCASVDVWRESYREGTKAVSHAIFHSKLSADFVIDIEAKG